MSRLNTETKHELNQQDSAKQIRTSNEERKERET